MAASLMLSVLVSWFAFVAVDDPPATDCTADFCRGDCAGVNIDVDITSVGDTTTNVKITLTDVPLIKVKTGNYGNSESLRACADLNGCDVWVRPSTTWGGVDRCGDLLLTCDA